MGYPMTYGRVVARNNLDGDYSPDDSLGYLKGDLRRLEKDSRDEKHLAHYARVAGITPEQAKKLLDDFFDEAWK